MGVNRVVINRDSVTIDLVEDQKFFEGVLFHPGADVFFGSGEGLLGTVITKALRKPKRNFEWGQRW